MSGIENSTYGVELEQPFVTDEGDGHAVGAAYFERLLALKRARGEQAELRYIGDTPVAVATPGTDESLDNGYNLGESATGPIAESEGGLTRLDEVLNKGLSDVASALRSEGAGILNMSNHPLTELTEATYEHYVVPKPAYGYVRAVRGWDHKAGINASAQNSPSTGISAYESADAVSVMIGLGGAMTALYANSPFSEGRVTGKLETRAGMWDQMFGAAAIRGDRRLHRLPEKPFKDLREYFAWMFGPDSNMFFVPGQSGGDARTANGVVHVDGNPPLLDYLAGDQWFGRVAETGEATTVRPTLGHLALHQFLQFSGARVRFGFADESQDPGAFMAAMRGRDTEVEAFMDEASTFMYIEGRDPGATFVDQELLDIVGDGDEPRSVIISPAAIQAGLLRNLPEARRLIDKYGWGTLMELRAQSAEKGLSAISGETRVSQVCSEMLLVAAGGLAVHETWMLAYPEFVLSTGQSGAVRALNMYDYRSEVTERDRIRAVVQRRRAIVRDTMTGATRP